MLTIDARSLSKRYILHGPSHNTLRDLIASLWRRDRFAAAEAEAAGCFWALRDVSFQVQQGEVLGVIGRNGAGKSTLLKLLTRVTSPTSGEADVHGRISSLLEVGTGFHPELTGRENVYLNGAILGMRRREIREKFEDIVAFAEVEMFIDTPVKRYSSGMYTRLAFAVAAHLEPEILIVDEVLAVGDLPFQRRCLAKMKEVASDGRTVLFVSHNLASLGELCCKGLVLEAGRVVHHGTISSAIGAYFATIKGGNSVTFAPQRKRAEIGRIDIDAEALGRGDIIVRLHFTASAPLSPPVGGIILTSLLGVPVYASNPRLHPVGFVPVSTAAGVITLSLPDPPLCSGSYRLSAWLGDWQGDYDSRLDAITFDFHSRSEPINKLAPEVAGHLNFPGQWSVSPALVYEN